MGLQQALSGNVKLPAGLGVGSSKSFRRVNLRKTQTQRRTEMARTRKGKNPAASLAGSVPPGGRPGFFLRAKLVRPRRGPGLLPGPGLTDLLLAIVDPLVPL